MAKPLRRMIFIWDFYLIYFIYYSMKLYPSWTGVVSAIGMAVTWLFAVSLVRNPLTRKSCLKDAWILRMLCWAFCALWVVALLHYDIKAETWSLAEYLRLFAIYCSSTLVCTLEFMVMLSFWGNLKWKHPIATVWFLILGSVGQASRHLIPSENNLELLANSSLPHEDPDMSHLSDSQLDEKVFYFF